MTYLGGNNEEEGRDIAIDNSGAAYVAGFTKSANVPTARPRQRLSGSGTDGFVAKLATSSSPYDETYNYDAVGNITLKGPTGNGKTYNYSTQSASCASAILIKRHDLIIDGTTTYCYNVNGNLLSTSARTYA